MRLVPQGGKGSRSKNHIAKRGLNGAEGQAGESMPKPGSQKHPSPLPALSCLSLDPLSALKTPASAEFMCCRSLPLREGWGIPAPASPISTLTRAGIQEHI